VLEIGAGLGRTAFYARQFGIHDYTIIDLPLTGVAQANFIGRTLGADAICLFGETRPGIRILPPSAFIDASDRYDLVINVDSLTELAPETARAYCEQIKARANLFVSINHERNPFTVRAICNEVGLTGTSRTPYWMRRGYGDELFTLGAAAPTRE
jgi:EAL domain-containing protein (putative c-di-GMP-specific phosphodiesterase class I)